MITGTAKDNIVPMWECVLIIGAWIGFIVMVTLMTRPSRWERWLKKVHKLEMDIFCKTFDHVRVK